MTTIKEKYLAWIANLVSLSALFHDLGKANKRFQNKSRAPKTLSSKASSDLFRHEYLSSLILILYFC